MEELTIIMLVAVTLWQQIKIHRLKKDIAQQWELMTINTQNEHNAAGAHKWFSDTLETKWNSLKSKTK